MQMGVKFDGVKLLFVILWNFHRTVRVAVINNVLKIYLIG